jgi:hypothetical protein
MMVPEVRRQLFFASRGQASQLLQEDKGIANRIIPLHIFLPQFSCQHFNGTSAVAELP